MSIEVRPLLPTDLPRVVELNNAAYPAVPLADEAELHRLAELSDPAWVAADGEEVVGFLLAIAPGSRYESENYRYFAERAESCGRSCLYIDRIVLSEAARGSGLGRRFYEAVFARAVAAGHAEVTCEVNIEPPNPASLAFHGRLGFDRVGEQSTKGGAFVVALLAAAVDSRRPAGESVPV